MGWKNRRRKRDKMLFILYFKKTCCCYKTLKLTNSLFVEHLIPIIMTLMMMMMSMMHECQMVPLPRSFVRSLALEKCKYMNKYIER
jgi:hypothetical protein